MKSFRNQAKASAKTKLAKLSGSSGTESNPGGNKLASMESPPRGSDMEPVTRGMAVATTSPKGGYARGGRTKGTNVNIIVGGQKPEPQPIPVPVPAAGPPPGAAPPMGGPPGMPPPGMMRKFGGRTVLKMAGADSGEGRLAKNKSMGRRGE